MILMDHMYAKIEGIIQEMKKMKDEMEQIKINQSNLNAVKDIINKETENIKSDLKLQIEKLNTNLKLNQEKVFPLPVCEELKQLMSLSHVWKVESIVPVLERKQSKTLSAVFPLSGYPFGAQVRLKLREDWVYVSLCFQDLSQGQEELRFRVIPRVSYVLKDLSGSKDRTRSISPLFNTSFSALRYGKFYYETVMDRASKLRLPMYLSTEEAVVLEVHVEPPSVATQMASEDGVLLGSIDHYRRKRRMALEELVLNQDGPYFYTHPQGYKVLARMGLNGHDAFKGKGLSLSVSFLAGPFDVLLTRSFRHRTTITLFNLKDPTKHLTKSIEQNIDKNLQYIIDVATNTEIDSFIENDVLYYKVQIKAI